MPSLANPAPAAARQRFPLLCLLPVLALLLAIAPVLPSGTPYHGDERFYTNGALMMMDSGDWVIPRWADGSPRLNKPPLTYWAVAASSRLFGVGLWQSRLPSALAGAALVGLTALLCWNLFRDRVAAVLAGWLAAANFQVQASAGRTIPDALLGAFLALALVGFTAILFPREEADGRSSPWWPYVAWLAIALAVLTKGMLPLILVGYVLFACAAVPGLRSRLRALLHPGALAAAVVVSLAWYAAVFHRLGDPALAVFWEDQVGGRVGTGLWGAAANCLGYVADAAGDAGVAVLLVVLGLVTRRGRETRRTAVRRGDRPGLLFLLGWLLLYVGVFSAANLSRGRYLLPAHPALCAVLALFVARSLPGTEDIHRHLTTLVRWLMGLMGFALLAAGVLLAPRLPNAWQMTAAGGLTLVVVGASVGLRAASPLSRLVGFLALAIFCSTVPAQAVRNGWREQPEAALVAALKAAGVPAGHVPSWQLSDRTAARLRLASGGTFWPENEDLAELVEAPPDFVLTEGGIPEAIAPAYRLLPAGVDRQWRPDLAGLVASRPPIREELRSRYSLALRTTEQAPTVIPDHSGEPVPTVAAPGGEPGPAATGRR